VVEVSVADFSVSEAVLLAAARTAFGGGDHRQSYCFSLSRGCGRLHSPEMLHATAGRDGFRPQDRQRPEPATAVVVPAAGASSGRSAVPTSNPGRQCVAAKRYTASEPIVYTDY
jgi:hypothetical protein